MILNRLERDYGISRVAELAKPWRGLSNTEKLDKVKELDAELNENECYCTEAMVEVCAVCKADNRQRYGDEIPFGG
ncbi:MAG: hypothetical protein ACYSW6_11740 [Planctomycetota bacterium]